MVLTPTSYDYMIPHNHILLYQNHPNNTYGIPFLSSRGNAFRVRSLAALFRLLLMQSKDARAESERA